MSRERPAEPPRAVPDAERGLKPQIERRKARQQAELEHLKRTGLVGLFAGFSALMTRGSAPTPQFIRRGYEANIIDDLGDFYRGRGWRRRHCRSGQTFKERLNASRGGRHAPKKLWRYVTDEKQAQSAEFSAGQTMGGEHA